MREMLWVTILFPAVCAVRGPAGTSCDFYVSPGIGSPNRLPGTKGNPFTSVTTAVAAAAQADGNCTIFLDASPRTCVHRVGTTITLDGRHADLTIARYRSDGVAIDSADRAIVSGGVTLTGEWTPPATGSVVWTLDLSNQSAVPRRFNQLFVDGIRATRAREPEIGAYFRMQGAAPSGFMYNGTDLDPLGALPSTQTLSTVEMVVYSSWMAARRNVAAIDRQRRTVRLTAPCRVEIDPYANSGARYYAENFAAACDTPTEWYLDVAARVLHYVPSSKESPPSTSTFVVPAVEELFVINGTSGVSIAGVTFQYADWSITPTNMSSGGVQAASFLTTAAIHLVNTTAAQITDCDVEHVGTTGIWVEGGSRDAILEAVFVRDTGAGGLRIGRGRPLTDEPALAQTRNITVIDSTFVFGSYVYHEGNGILLQHSSGNSIRRTEVAHYNHVGISVGWTWDYSPSTANSNLVESCHVHHVGNGDLSDLGGIYLLGVSPGTVVRGNLVHDANPYFQYGHGIYLDQASSFISVTGNALYSTAAAVCLQHFGASNEWLNNVVGPSFGGYGQLLEANFQEAQFGPSNLTFSRNMVIAYGTNPLFQSPFNGTWQGDYNLYWNLTSPTSAGISSTFPSDPSGRTCVNPSSPGCTADASMAEWQAQSGQDLHSLIADPLLVGDIWIGDFAVNAESPALTKLGMVPINVTRNNTGPPLGKRRDWDACSPDVTCGAPEPLVNGKVVGSPKWACGDTAVFHCDVGYLVSPTTSTWRRCLPSGRWSGTPTVCAPVPGPGRWLPQNQFLYSGNVIESNTSFLIQQGDGNLCLYKGSLSHNEGGLWCSQGHTAGETYVVVQDDGNFCTRDVHSNAAVWCSGSNQPDCPGHASHIEDVPEHCTFFVAVDGDQVCVHRGSSPSDDRGTIWCAPKTVTVPY